MKTNLLKAARAKESLTQAQVSEALNIPKYAYSKRENNKTQFKISELKALRTLLNLTDEEFLNIFFN